METLAYTAPLSDEKLKKVCAIEDYNKAFKRLSGHNIPTQLFDVLWDCPTDVITSQTYSINMQVNGHHY